MATNTVSKFYLKTAIFMAIILGISFLPAPAPITPYGMKVIGVFLGMIYGWCALGMIWPSILGILATALLGILPINTVFANGWGSNVMLLIFFMMMLAKTLQKEGLCDFIALWFISRKFVLGRPWLFSYSLFLALAIVSSMTSACAMILLGWAIFYGISEEIGEERYSPYSTFMIIGITIACALGDGLFPFRTVGIVAFALMESISGYVLNSFVYTVWIFCMLLVMLAMYICVGRFIYRIQVDNLKRLDAEYFANKNLSLNKRQKTMLGLMVLLICMMLLPSITPSTWILSVIFNKIGATGVAAFICLVMCILHIGGEPLMNPKEAITTGVSFDVIFLGAACLPLAMGVFSSEEAGITAFISLYLAPIFEGKSVLIFMILATTISTILTNFLINVTVPTIVYPALYPIGIALGVHPVAMMVVIVYGCLLALLLPSASPMAAITFGNSEWVRAKDIYKYGGTFVGIALVIVWLSMPLIMIIFS